MFERESARHVHDLFIGHLLPRHLIPMDATLEAIQARAGSAAPHDGRCRQVAVAAEARLASESSSCVLETRGKRTFFSSSGSDTSVQS